MKVCISGAGIAGPALAHWLLHHGHEPTLVEVAPRFRRGGYVVDFWGKGYELAERMGVRHISLTITHSGNLALAQVIFEN